MHFDIKNYIPVKNFFEEALSNFLHMEKLDTLLVHEKMSFVGLLRAWTIPADRSSVKIGALLAALILVCFEGLLL